MNVVGWDIGGVHLKAARAERGCIVDALQLAAPLRAGLDPLVQAFAVARARMGSAQRHVVTMTAELADTFASRHEGVDADRRAGGARARRYGIALRRSRRLRRDRTARTSTSSTSRPPIGMRAPRWSRAGIGSALFIDMGSTTTDIVPVADGAIAARGYTDAERLAAGELVYTGLVRGFVMATAGRAPFAGAWTPLVNENFANMADVHRILGSLPDGADQMSTADGRDKTVASSRARLARMVGRDAADADAAAWEGSRRDGSPRRRCARSSTARCWSSPPWPLAHDAPVVGAGIGSGIARAVARRLDRPFIAFETLLDAVPHAREAASLCAPAAALALLGSSA